MKKRIKQLWAFFLTLAMLCTSIFTGGSLVFAAETVPETMTPAALEAAAANSGEYLLKSEQIRIRDPYIVPYEGKYYLYGTDGENAFSGAMNSFHVYVSEDLKNWAGPYAIYQKTDDFWADAQYWAPEVYVIDGAFYLYGSMGGSGRANKGIQVFKADNPLGPFVPTTDYPFTPETDDDIDATLYVEDGKTYMVYSQGSDGIYAVELNETYDGFAAEQFKLFDVAESGWAVGAFGNFILNDGPCLYQTQTGRLLCLYSTMSDTGYNMGIAVSDNGKLNGNWSFEGGKLLSEGDGGHCMLFTDFDGNTRICYHAPNGNSVPVIKYLAEDTQKDTVYISDNPPAAPAHVSHVGKTFFAEGLKYKVTKDDNSGREVRVTSMSVKTTALKIPAKVTNTSWGESFKVTSIKAKAFKGTSITKVTVGKNVSKIGPNAFKGCTKLRTVVLKAGVKTIGTRAFYGCSKLTKVTIRSKVLKTVKKNAFKRISRKAVIKVPAAQKTKYTKLLKKTAAKGVTIK